MRRPAIPVVFLLALGACDDPAEPDLPASLFWIDIDIDGPVSVQANDSFDVAIEMVNDTAEATRPQTRPFRRLRQPHRRGARGCARVRGNP